jgi:hypothetical protein
MPEMISAVLAIPVIYDGPTKPKGNMLFKQPTTYPMVGLLSCGAKQLLRMLIHDN